MSERIHKQEEMMKEDWPRETKEAGVLDYDLLSEQEEAVAEQGDVDSVCEE